MVGVLICWHVRHWWTKLLRSLHMCGHEKTTESCNKVWSTPTWLAISMFWYSLISWIFSGDVGLIIKCPLWNNKPFFSVIYPCLLCPSWSCFWIEIKYESICCSYLISSRMAKVGSEGMEESCPLSRVSSSYFLERAFTALLLGPDLYSIVKVNPINLLMKHYRAGVWITWENTSQMLQWSVLMMKGLPSKYCLHRMTTFEMAYSSLM